MEVRKGIGKAQVLDILLADENDPDPSGTVPWRYDPVRGPAEIRTPNGTGTLPLAARSSRIVKGHPEGFHEAFANIYSDAAEAIAARIAGKEADPLAMFFPNSYDGLMGVRFVHKVIESSLADGKWVSCEE